MTESNIRWLLGLALLMTGWYLPRLAAGTRLRLSPALPMDLLIPCSLFLLVLACSARPLLAGIVTLAMGAGWSQADRDKRRVLAEPIVFTDIYQALDIARHPRLAVPFPHKGRIVLAALGTIAFFTLVVWLEPAAWQGMGWLIVLLLLAAYSFVRLGRVLLPRLYQNFRQRHLSADPARDAAQHGALATILLHGLFAGHERATLQATYRQATATLKTAPGTCGPVVLVQNESFFDARRLHSAIPKNLLPHFDRGCRDSLQWGRFGVPSWGANTVRTEFAVLSGLSQQALGFDRFNPYFRLADAPLQSLAWQLRTEGYHTVCLHPFDRHFYRRHIVLPNLGFDEFLGEEQFAGAPRINGYVPDIEVAKVAEQIIRERGPKVFLFIITMENHGPWSGAPDRQIGDLAGLPLDESERLGLNHYLSSLVHADAMFGRLRTMLENQNEPAVLGFYGDHLPSFPSIYSKLDWQDTRSDYLIWRSHGGSGLEQVLTAEDLGAAILRAR